MKVLITRPLEQGQLLKEELSQLSINAELLPFFDVVRTPQVLEDQIFSFALTSQNAVYKLENYPNKNISIFTVGNKTAEAVKHLGFQNVMSANGNAEDLVQLIKAHAPHHVTYLAGADIAFDLVEALSRYHIPCKSIEVYSMRPADLQDVLPRGITHVLFFSKRAAQYYKSQFKHQENLVALCMSEAVKDVLSMLNWKKIWVAPHPSTQGMIGYFHGQQENV